MSNQLCKIRYECLHTFCQAPCKKGELTFDEESFSDLSADYDDESLLKSPPDYCRLGFTQRFKVISKVTVEPSQVPIPTRSETVPGDVEVANPLEILMAEDQFPVRR